MLYIPAAPSQEYKKTSNNPHGFRDPMDRKIPFKDL